MAARLVRRRRRNPSGGFSPARKDSLLKRLEAIAGRGELVAALEWSSDARAWAVVSMMCDPSYARFSFAKLCERAGLGYREVLDFFRRLKLDEGLLRMSSHFPDVAEGTAIDAMSRLETCPECNGLGKVRRHVCRECYGHGEVRIVGDHRARRLVYESLGLIGRRAPLVAQQFNFGIESVESFGKTQKLIGAPFPPKPGEQKKDGTEP